MAFQTTLELAQFIEHELGHDTSGPSAQRADILSHLDNANKVVMAGGGILNFDDSGKRKRSDVVFSFAKNITPKVLTLLPELTTATITVNREASSIMFDVAPDGANSVAGYFLRVNNESEVYQISTHVAASTTATIDGGYVGEANVVAGACEIFKLQYDVGSSDILRLCSPIRCYSSNRERRQISLVDKDEFLDQFPLEQVTMTFPQLASVLRESAGTYTVQFSSFPDDLERIEVDYLAIPATLDTTSVNPTMPAHFRILLAHLVIYYMSLRNDDARAREHLAIARDKFSELVDWNDQMFTSTDPNYGRIVILGFNRPLTPRVKRDNTDSR